MKVNQENIYWLFSSSAQAISSFVAFLLTGFAIVLSVMEGLQQRDDSLEEIHHELKRRYYKHISWFSGLTATAIIASLLMIFLNGEDFPFKTPVIIIVAILNVAAIIGGVFFVLSMIDPDKYRNVAKEIIEQDEKKALSKPSSQKVEYTDFSDPFIKLEQNTRELIKRKNIPVGNGPIRRAYSFRQMIDALYFSETIDKRSYEELKYINRYRNLVFHGEVDRVDPDMVEMVKNYLETVSNMLADEPIRAIDDEN